MAVLAGDQWHCAYPVQIEGKNLVELFIPQLEWNFLFFTDVDLVSSTLTNPMEQNVRSAATSMNSNQKSLRLARLESDTSQKQSERKVHKARTCYTCAKICRPDVYIATPLLGQWRYSSYSNNHDELHKL
jgi:hypothetical protein